MLIGAKKRLAFSFKHEKDILKQKVMTLEDETSYFSRPNDDVDDDDDDDDVIDGDIVAPVPVPGCPRTHTNTNDNLRLSTGQRSLNWSQNYSQSLRPRHEKPPVDSNVDVVKRKKSSAYTNHQWMTIFILGLINFSEGVIISLQAPFYPAEAEKKGATATEYGLIFGIFELVVFLVSPIFGKYMTKIGTKFILNAGIFITSTCCILFGFLDKVEGRDAFVGLSFAVRIVQAVGEAGYMTASFTMIASEFPNNVATTFAALETCFGLGIIAGPTIGGALYQIGGFPLPFISLGGFLFVAACITFIILPAPTANSNSDCSKNVLDILKIPAVFLATLTTFCGASAIGFITALLEPHLRQFHLSPVLNGMMFIISGGVYAALAPIWGWLCDRVGQTKLFCIAGALSSCVAFLLIGPAPFLPIETQLWICIVALIFHGIGTGGEIVCAFLGSLKESVKHGYPDNLNTYGLVSALWSSAFALGAFVGPSVAGLLYDNFGFRTGSLFILFEQALLASILIFYLAHRKWCTGTTTSSKLGNLEISYQDEQKPLLGAMASKDYR